MKITRSLIVGGAVVALVGLLAGCSGASSSAPIGGQSSSTASSGLTDSASVGSADDIAFVQLMIPHHQQAMTMADLALAKASTSEVRLLAKQIKAAQSPEIATMAQWLTDWDAPILPPSSPSGHEMGNMADPRSSGMMSDEELSLLLKSTGSAFDQMWLQMMIAHHQGAIMMADQVLESTTNLDVRDLAQMVIEGQTAEITTMQELLSE
ncbi:MAG: DUF305 domain-containing protein [Actinomycetota bacterium]|nr:DUF305 domain-containing protein [Actinomycetota bacterium]